MAFPSNPARGDVHSEFGNSYTYNGISWVEGWAVKYSGTDIIADNVEPTNATTGTQWLDMTTNQIKQYDGSTWNVIGSI